MKNRLRKRYERLRHGMASSSWQWLLSIGLVVVGSGLTPEVGAVPAAIPAWSDDFITRVQALALLQSFNADLLSHHSATLVLQRWCGAHALAEQPVIRAKRMHVPDKPLPGALRAGLRLADGERVRYRRVQLICGRHVLSEADNWYVPARLTAAMNWALDHSETPFGKVVAPLQFRRETLSADLLWQPLPTGWEMHKHPMGRSHALLHIPKQILQHHALLYRRDNQPVSALIETYTNQLLAFPLGDANAGKP